MVVARGVVLCVCLCVCLFSVFCLLALSGVQREVSAATARKMQFQTGGCFTQVILHIISTTGTRSSGRNKQEVAVFNIQ